MTAVVNYVPATPQIALYLHSRAHLLAAGMRHWVAERAARLRVEAEFRPRTDESVQLERERRADADGLRRSSLSRWEINKLLSAGSGEGD